MTAEKKAEELISQFLWPQRKFEELAKRDVAKDCAIKCCDEVINSLPTYNPSGNVSPEDDHVTAITNSIDFWVRVKSEIQKQ